MANALTGAFGLRPVRKIDGSPYNGATQKCYISGSYAVALFIGDGVIFDTVIGDKDPTGRYPTVIAWTGAAAGLCRGVIVSFDPLVTDLSKQYNPASTERYANVCMDQDVIYQIMDDGAGAPTKVFPGQNATATLASGSTVTGLSGATLDTTTPATDQTAPLHIIGLAEIVNNALDDYAVWEVLLNTASNATGRFLGVTAT